MNDKDASFCRCKPRKEVICENGLTFLRDLTIRSISYFYVPFMIECEINDRPRVTRRLMGTFLDAVILHAHHDAKAATSLIRDYVTHGLGVNYVADVRKPRFVSTDTGELYSLPSLELAAVRHKLKVIKCNVHVSPDFINLPVEADQQPLASAIDVVRLLVTLNAKLDEIEVIRCPLYPGEGGAVFATLTTADWTPTCNYFEAKGPLHYAAAFLDVETVKSLLKSGADPYVVDDAGDLALHAPLKHYALFQEDGQIKFTKTALDKVFEIYDCFQQVGVTMNAASTGFSAARITDFPGFHGQDIEFYQQLLMRGLTLPPTDVIIKLLKDARTCLQVIILYVKAGCSRELSMIEALFGTAVADQDVMLLRFTAASNCWATRQIYYIQSRRGTRYVRINVNLNGEVYDICGEMLNSPPTLVEICVFAIREMLIINNINILYHEWFRTLPVQIQKFITLEKWNIVPWGGY